MRGHTLPRSLPIYLLLLFSPYDQIGASTPTSTTTTPGDITWTSPASRSTFSPGDMPVAKWSSPEAISIPSFRACFDLSTSDGLGVKSHDHSDNEDGSSSEGGKSNCGDASWPGVQQTSGSYTTTLIAPNIQMEDDTGRIVTAPWLSVHPSPPASIQNQNEGDPQSAPLSSSPTSDPSSSNSPPAADQDPPMTNSSLSVSPSQSTADASSKGSEPGSFSSPSYQSSSNYPPIPEAETDPSVERTPPFQPIADAGTNPFSTAPPSSPPSSDSQQTPEDEQGSPAVTRTHASHSQSSADTDTISEPNEYEPPSPSRSPLSSSSAPPHSSSRPSALSSPLPNLSATLVPPPTAAYAVPLTLVGVALVVATAIVAYQRRTLAKTKVREVEAGLGSSEDEKPRDGKMGSVRWGSVDDVIFFCDSLSRGGGRGQVGGIACVPPIVMRRPTTREAFAEHHPHSHQAMARTNTRTPSSTSTIQNPKASVKWRIANMPDEEEMDTIPLSPLSTQASRPSSPVSHPSYLAESSYSHSSSHSSSHSKAFPRTLSSQRPHSPHSPLSPSSIISSYFDVGAPHEKGGSSMSTARYHADASSVYSHDEVSLTHTRSMKGTGQ